MHWYVFGISTGAPSKRDKLSNYQHTSSRSTAYRETSIRPCFAVSQTEMLFFQSTDFK